MNRTILHLFLSCFLFLSSIVEAACNTESPERFDYFFLNWAADKQFSVKRTVFPFKTIKYDSGGSESEPIYGRVTKAEFEQSPTLSEYMKANALSHEIGSVTASKAILKVFKEGTDWQYEYHFKKRSGCWYLYEFENQSL